MSEKIKSLVRHALTVLGTVLTLVGLDGFVDIFDFVQTNLDMVVNSVMTLIGFVTTLLGFFKDGKRFNIRLGD